MNWIWQKLHNLLEVVKYETNCSTSVTGKEISTQKTSEDWKLF